MGIQSRRCSAALKMDVLIAMAADVFGTLGFNRGFMERIERPI
jgi:hypothetical protein